MNGDGVLFGLVSREVRNEADTHLYGVTCQVYEKGSDSHENVSFKSRAYQRFYILSKEYVYLVQSTQSYLDFIWLLQCAQIKSKLDLHANLTFFILILYFHYLDFLN